MTNLSKFFVVIGCLLLLIAIVCKVTGFSFMIGCIGIKISSLLILTNTAFILAVLFKK